MVGACCSAYPAAFVERSCFRNLDLAADLLLKLIAQGRRGHVLRLSQPTAADGLKAVVAPGDREATSTGLTGPELIPHTLPMPFKLEKLGRFLLRGLRIGASTIAIVELLRNDWNAGISASLAWLVFLQVERQLPPPVDDSET